MLNLSANGSVVVREDTRVIFLDEFRIVVFVPDVPEFTLFDTCVPPGHPVNSRRFCFPLRYHDWFFSVHVDTDRCLGTLDQDRPLVTDPAQAVLLLKLASQGYEGHVLLIVRIHTLIEHVRSMNPSACVSWEVWGRGVAVMDFQILRSDGSRYLLVQGVRVILAKMCTLPGATGYHPSLRIFDFGQRGWGTLPPWEEANGAERRVSFENGRDFLLGGSGDSLMNEWGFNKLGEGNFMYLVSHFRRWKSDGKLMRWEGQNPQFGRCATCLGAGMR